MLGRGALIREAKGFQVNAEPPRPRILQPGMGAPAQAQPVCTVVPLWGSQFHPYPKLTQGAHQPLSVHSWQMALSSPPSLQGEIFLFWVMEPFAGRERAHDLLVERRTRLCNETAARGIGGSLNPAWTIVRRARCQKQVRRALSVPRVPQWFQSPP